MPRTGQARSRLQLGWGIALLIALVAGILGSYWLVRRWLRRPAPIPERRVHFAPPVEGLTEKEAAARQPDIDLDKMARREHWRFLGRAIWNNLFTFVNIDLFSIGILMLILGSPLSTLGSLFILVMNLFLNVFQEVYTKIKLDRLVRSLRPQATVIREGQIKSIDPVRIAPGDMLVVGPGDEILVDGEIVGDDQILVEESPAGDDGGQALKQSGDPVYAGSYCLDGRAVYRCSQVDPSRLVTVGGGVEILSGEPTPLESLIQVVLRALFGLVILFSVLLLLDATLFKLRLFTPAYREAFSIIFGIAPTSLFFILVVQYGVGALRVANQGALAYRSQSIESLANVSVLCLGLGSLLSGVQVRLLPVPGRPGPPPLSENLVRRALGDCVHSQPTDTPADSALAEALPGVRRTPVETAPFFSLHGWYAMTFNDPDLRGTFVIGESEVLAPYLAQPETEAAPSRGVQDTLAGTLRGLSRLPRRLGRGAGQVEVEADTPRITPAEPAEPGNGTPMPDLLSEEEPEPSRLERFGDWLERTIGPREEMPEAPSDEPEPADLAAWLFAYLPDVAPLYDQNGGALLPANLIPLTGVSVAETARPEARQTIRAFNDAGVSVKILASENPTRAAGTAKALGLEFKQAAVVSGDTLAGLDRQGFAETVREATVFADLSRTQKANILTFLRKQGEYVAMVGDSPSDVPAMRQANLKVALRSGSQAALTETDIVLLKDSLEALPRVLVTAQRLVSGILDTFKLYLSQLSMQLLLILVVALLQLGHYPYNPTQAGVISAFTIAFPVIFLAIWSYPSIVSEESIRRQLIRFVIPVAVTLSILALVVFAWFVTRTKDPDYAQLGVTYALLAAGWLRLLFVQPPTPFWVGGAELRGDRRVIWLVVGTILFFTFIMSFPLLREWLFFDLLDSVPDYLAVALAVALWAVGLRAIWRARLMEPVVNRFSRRPSAS